MDSIFGGSPLGVIVRLAIVSIIVGIILAALGLEPFDVFNGLRRLMERVYDMGFEAIEKGLGYFVTGALIVVPIWIVARLLQIGRSKKG